MRATQTTTHTDEPQKDAYSSLRRLFLLTVGAALLFETNGGTTDPMSTLGANFQHDITSWSGIHIIFSVLELLLIVIAAAWAVARLNSPRAPHFLAGSLFRPLMVFFGLVAVGVVHGLLTGGDSTVALWEVRGFLMLVGIYLLTGIFLQNEHHIHDLIWVVLIAATSLAVDNSLRYLTLLRGKPQDDGAFDHIDSVVLVFAIMLCLCLLIFGGTRKQRRYSLFVLPLFLFTLETMARRAAFAILAVALIVLMMLLLRLRPKLFLRTGLPAIILITVYLIIFWHSQSIWGQPARALSSTISPDPRDYASNLYRNLELIDIQGNIAANQLFGLGFGHAFVFYVQLPNLSFWRFWRYTTHDAILWVWMKDGIFGFISFWWLNGLAVAKGSQALEQLRERWTFREKLKARWRRGKTTAEIGKAQMKAVPVPSIFGSPESERRAGVTAFVAAGICMIPMQVAFSYVDLGLTDERNMLLLGIVFSVLANASHLLKLHDAQPAAVDPNRSTASGTSRPTTKQHAPLQDEVLANQADAAWVREEEAMMAGGGGRGSQNVGATSRHPTPPFVSAGASQWREFDASQLDHYDE